MCDCDCDMPANVRYYLLKITGLLGKCPAEIPAECAEKLIATVEAKTSDEPKPQEPESDGSEGADMAPQSGD